MTTTQRMTTSRPYNPTTHVNPINPFNPVTGSISILVVEGERYRDRDREIQKQIDREFFLEIHHWIHIIRGEMFIVVFLWIFSIDIIKYSYSVQMC